MSRMPEVPAVLHKAPDTNSLLFIIAPPLGLAVLAVAAVWDAAPAVRALFGLGYVIVLVLYFGSQRLLTYRLYDAGLLLTSGLVRDRLPFARMRAVEVVDLPGRGRRRGVTLPGFYTGTYAYPRLGPVELRGSRSRGAALLIVLDDGTRYVITPQAPTAARDFLHERMRLHQPGRTSAKKRRR